MFLKTNKDRLASPNLEKRPVRLPLLGHRHTNKEPLDLLARYLQTVCPDIGTFVNARQQKQAVSVLYRGY
jgi:hypothetical protein